MEQVISKPTQTPDAPILARIDPDFRPRATWSGWSRASPRAAGSSSMSCSLFFGRASSRLAWSRRESMRCIPAACSIRILFASFLASFFFGMFLSATVFSFISDWLGRRAIFVQSMVVYSIAAARDRFPERPSSYRLRPLVAGLAVGIAVDQQ